MGEAEKVVPIGVGLEKPLVLSTAYATWVQGTDFWAVMDQDKNKIGEFPKKWDAKECMIAIRLGRKYEVEAFNIGIDFGKSEYKRVYSPIMDGLKKQVEELMAMNEKLSTQLERHIIGGD